MSRPKMLSKEKEGRLMRLRCGKISNDDNAKSLGGCKKAERSFTNVPKKHVEIERAERQSKFSPADKRLQLHNAHNGE